MFKKIVYLGLGIVGIFADAIGCLIKRGEEELEGTHTHVEEVALTTEVVTAELVPTGKAEVQVVGRRVTAVAPNDKPKMPARTDDLTAIKGIGPTFARRLKEAGITTYAALANLTADQVRTITQMADWQGDPADWIAQAQALA